ncbi:MAG: FHA domain-containing protein, partial [Rhodocyclaceae bacterium]|nr:FHA domain-containing protein [Rhodocyclaceae bacterium]
MKVQIIDSKGQRSELHVAADTASIGRGDDNAIILKGWTVGKRQASIESRANGLYLVDHGGISVTEVNGKTVEGEYGPLTPDDEIGIAGYALRVLTAGGETASPPAITPEPAKPTVPAPDPFLMTQQLQATVVPTAA